jgi:hypothetical protein
MCGGSLPSARVATPVSVWCRTYRHIAVRPVAVAATHGRPRPPFCGQVVAELESACAPPSRVGWGGWRSMGWVVVMGGCVLGAAPGTNRARTALPCKDYERTYVHRYEPCTACKDIRPPCF